MNYKQIVLNILLDKYEKSKSYLENVNRRVIIKADNIKQYNIENFEEKVIFHETIKELKNKNIIDFDWIRFEENNILNQIWLIKENINKAYEEICRKNPKRSYQEILEILENIEFKQKWIQQFSVYIKEYMKNNQKEHNLLPCEKSKEIIRALQEIDRMQCQSKTNNVLKRIFSIKCYNDSKFFEREIEKNLVRIMKEYYNTEEENLDIAELTPDELLAEIGIVKYPEVIEFCGNMKCEINSKELVFLDETLGNYINSHTIMNIQDIELINVNKIIFIENKTNYINYIQNKKEDEFVIYHGGMYSPIKGEFFKKVYEASKKVEKEIKYYHWSDIDIGGFKIFTRLRDNVIRELVAYKMDKDTLIKYQDNWQIFNEKYAKKLLTLRSLENYSCFFEVIDFMLQKNIKLEQESIIS